MRFYSYLVLPFVCYVEGYNDGYDVNITIDSSYAILGSSISFVANLFMDDGGTPPSATYIFDWHDNAFKKHEAQVEGHDMITSAWSPTYPSDQCSPGEYEVEVVVSRKTIIPWKIASQRKTFKLTMFLNGDIVMLQNGTSRDDNLVSSTKPIVNRVSLTPADSKFVNVSTKSIKSFWFVNETYVGNATGLDFPFNYTKFVNKDVVVKAVVVVSPVNGSAPANLTVEPEVDNELAAMKKAKKPDLVTAPYLNPSFECTPDPDNIYGCFSKNITVREEVHDVQVDGNSWLPHGEMLNLTVNCGGSGPYWHCVKIMTGEYNATGMESCLKSTVTNNCAIKVVHYFLTPGEYTLLFIIGNSISKVVTPVRVNIFQVQKHAQLSVIIVPVSFSVLAVVLIVFGVAYYIQSRNRYIVEVADFDFAAPSCDTEYKTVAERLREAVSTAINRTQDYSADDSGGGSIGGHGASNSVWSPSRKYGSMQ